MHVCIYVAVHAEGVPLKRAGCVCVVKRMPCVAVLMWLGALVDMETGSLCPLLLACVQPCPECLRMACGVGM